MNLVFASNNKNKLKEIRSILDFRFKVLSLSDINFFEELPETSDTIEGNALQKALYVYENIGYRMSDVGCKKNSLLIFADDTGLEIEALGGKPGVISARYAGEHCSAEDNIQKVLAEMEGVKNRKAVFRCIISLIMDGKETQFEGRMEGKILTEKRGTEGFGYDPIFAPTPISFGEGQGGRSFAEMTSEEKNRISHRAVAVRKMKEFLLQNFTL